VAPFGERGWVAVRGSRSGSQLVLEVRDSGPGVAPERLAGLNRGVGLANTRARLEHLYGSSHQFVFSNEPAGFCVTVRLPFRLDIGTEAACAGVA
jgi:sensor histidine kinase YesM